MRLERICRASGADDVLVATWNVSNVPKRQDRLLQRLGRRTPGVVALQELKNVTGDFPVEELEAAR